MTMSETPQHLTQTEPAIDSALAAAVRRAAGLSLERVLPSPFLIIKCPLCGASEFTTLEFASTWCDSCNAQFQVYRATGEGFGVSCTWRFCRPREARYLLPVASRLSLRLTVHWAADPRRPACDSDVCARVEGCSPGALKLTDEHHPLVLARLHACTLGELAGWYLEGHAPGIRDMELDCSFDPVPVDRESWPICAAIPIPEYDSPLAIHPWAELPSLAGLQPGEWYLLYHWRLTLGAAWPVWYRVRPRWVDDRFDSPVELDVVERGA
jgi:hypothetical protein